MTIMTFLSAVKHFVGTNPKKMAVTGGVLNYAKKYARSDSLVRYTQTTRVEPIVMIDDRAQHLAYLSDVLQSLLALFGAYYLQAASLQVNIGKINVGKFLNPLNPDRPFLESYNAALESHTTPAAHQDYRFGLPSANRVSVESLPAFLRPALEDNYPAAYGSTAYNPDDDGSTPNEKTRIPRRTGETLHTPIRDADKATETDDDKKEPKDYKGDSKFSMSLDKDLRESANLSIGRLFTVEISDDGHKASIPVLIRLLTTMVATPLLVHILSDGSRVRTSSAKERWYAYKSKELKFWRDLVFCQDLIDEHKKALLADNSGVYSNILQRSVKNAASAALSQEPSVGTASNMLVVTRETIKDLEHMIGGKFDRFEVRQKLFETTYLMIVAVVDPMYDHVTFYHRGIAQSSEMSVRELKMAQKGSGPDVSELLKAYVSGTAPAF